MASISERAHGHAVSIDDAYARFPDAMASYDKFAWEEPSSDTLVPDLTWPMSEREAQGRGESDAVWFVEGGRLTCRSLSGDDLVWDGSDWITIDRP